MSQPVSRVSERVGPAVVRLRDIRKHRSCLSCSGWNAWNATEESHRVQPRGSGAQGKEVRQCALDDAKRRQRTEQSVEFSSAGGCRSSTVPVCVPGVRFTPTASSAQLAFARVGLSALGCSSECPFPNEGYGHPVYHTPQGDFVQSSMVASMANHSRAVFPTWRVSA